MHVHVPWKLYTACLDVRFHPTIFGFYISYIIVPYSNHVNWLLYYYTKF